MEADSYLDAAPGHSHGAGSAPWEWPGPGGVDGRRQKCGGTARGPVSEKKCLTRFHFSGISQRFRFRYSDSVHLQGVDPASTSWGRPARAPRTPDGSSTPQLFGSRKWKCNVGIPKPRPPFYFYAFCSEFNARVAPSPFATAPAGHPDPAAPCCEPLRELRVWRPTCRRAPELAGVRSCSCPVCSRGATTRWYSPAVRRVAGRSDYLSPL